MRKINPVFLYMLLPIDMTDNYNKDTQDELCFHFNTAALTGQNKEVGGLFA